MSSTHQQRRISPVVEPVTANPDAELSLFNFTSDGKIPNHPQLPVMVWQGVVPSDVGDDAIKALFERNGWRRVWTWKVFDYQHFHPNAHEVLCVTAGSAQIQLGGSNGPTFNLSTGDAVILPAGTGHCSIDASKDFTVCGGYPPDQVDRLIMAEGDMSLGEAQAAVARVSLPATDPFFGLSGPLVSTWRAAVQAGQAS